MLKVYKNPIEGFRRYLFSGGQYPTTVALNAPGGQEINIVAYSHHDILTINEIFCRRDYPAPSDACVVVDFGSNIGISALYFLTTAPNAFVYCYEPLPWNCEKLRKMLVGYETRYEINQCAVGLENGNVTFFFEPSGRYGGVKGISFCQGEKTMVPCRTAAGEIARILAQHGKIDVLKIDIEGLEEDVLKRLSADQLAHIDNIYAEASLERGALQRSYQFRNYAGIAQFTST